MSPTDLRGADEYPALAGAAFLSAWSERSTKELLEYIKAGMPPDGKALAESSYLDVTAYILQVNGATAGDHARDASTSAPIGSLMPRG